MNKQMLLKNIFSEFWYSENCFVCLTLAATFCQHSIYPQTSHLTFLEHRALTLHIRKGSEAPSKEKNKHLTFTMSESLKNFLKA